MGYSTEFEGELKFTRELTPPELAIVNSFFHEDAREHPEWGEQKFYYIDLEFNRDFSGIVWDGSEKTYGMVDAVNLIISEVQKQIPDFGLSGTMQAQGEEIGDVWELRIGEDGLAFKYDLPKPADIVCCPQCDHKFRIEDSRE